MDRVANPLLPLLDELDRLNLRELVRVFAGEPGASSWPWETDSPDIRAVWERLTRPENLTAWEDWGRDMRGWCGFAVACTVMAVETCRVRAGGPGGLRPVADCTPEALAAIRRRCPEGTEFPPRWRTVG